MRFVYPELYRRDSQSGRTYITPCGETPSVTTILSRTTDQAWLSEWIARVGQEEADRRSKEGADIGTAMHNYIERHLRKEDQPEPATAEEKRGFSMGSLVCRRILSRVKTIYGIEAKLYYGSLYAGTSDLVAEWDGEISILDYKSASSSTKMHDKNVIAGYGMQLAAYAMAHNRMFDTDIKQLVIIHCSRHKDMKVTRISGRQFTDACNGWVDCIQRYYAAEDAK